MAEATYGLVELDGAQLALTLDALREVVPLPPVLAPMPSPAKGFLGAMDLRGLIVPVLDLAALLGADPGPQDATTDRPRGRAVVAVVVHDDRVLGLVADRVRGVTAVPQDALQPMTTGDASLLFRSTFRHPDGGGVVTVLDPDAILSLPGLPSASGRTSGRLTADAGLPGTGGSAGLGVPTTWFRCGEHHFGVAAVDIVAVLPPTVPRPSPLQGPLCTGITVHRDTEIATVDLLRVLDLGSQPTDEPLPAVLLRPGDAGYVALTVSQVVDVLGLPLGETLPLPPGTLGRTEYLRGVLPRPDSEPLLVVDVPALNAHPDLTAMARLNRTTRTGRHSDDGPRARTTAVTGTYLTYTVGRRGICVATPLSQVLEILPYPPDAARGMFVHRGQAVPLVALADVLDEHRPPDPAHDVVLLVGPPGQRTGFVVTALEHIESATWYEEPSGRTTSDPGLGQRLSRTALVRVTRPGAAERLVPDVDLDALVPVVRGGTSAA